MLLEPFTAYVTTGANHRDIISFQNRNFGRFTSFTKTVLNIDSLFSSRDKYEEKHRRMDDSDRVDRNFADGFVSC